MASLVAVMQHNLTFVPLSPMQTIDVKAKPNARQSSLAQLADGTWQADLKSPPVDGKANKELVALVAKHFGVAKSEVMIKSGVAGRLKRVIIRDDSRKNAT